MSATQKIIVSISSVVFIGLLVFPPWYQTNGQFVKQLGRHFFVNKPEAVPVECYLPGCVTAPASYFYVMLDRRSWLVTQSTIAFIAASMFLVFRIRPDGTSPSIGDRKTRLAFSGLVALALPISLSPVLLLGTYGAYVPGILFSGEHNWFWGSIFFPVIFCAYVGASYLATTIALRIAARRRQVSAPAV